MGKSIAMITSCGVTTVAGGLNKPKITDWKIFKYHNGILEKAKPHRKSRSLSYKTWCARSFGGGLIIFFMYGRILHEILVSGIGMYRINFWSRSRSFDFRFSGLSAQHAVKIAGSESQEKQPKAEYVCQQQCC